MKESNMNLKSECFSCLLNQSLRVTKNLQLDESIAIKIVKLASKSISNYSEVSPPVAASDLYLKLGNFIENDDVYKELKVLSTQEAMKILPRVEKYVASSQEPLNSAIKSAVAGNVIDFATPNYFDLDLEFKKVFDTSFAIDDESLFLDRLRDANSLMIIGDNVGEHVFDKLLLETLHNIHPDIQLYYAVRGKPIINDVTLVEAKEIGIDKICNLVDSGVDTPGLAYSHASKEFMTLYNSMDLIIAKGMGNYECLEDVKDSRIFHLFKVKCDVISKDVGEELGSLIFMQNRLRA